MIRLHASSAKSWTESDIVDVLTGLDAAGFSDVVVRPGGLALAAGLIEHPLTVYLPQGTSRDDAVAAWEVIKAAANQTHHDVWCCWVESDSYNGCVYLMDDPYRPQPL